MLYLDYVIIKNFQSHKETRLEFVPGLNVIVGPSDQGKSSIIRAINWALFNEPRGTDFIRQGTSECSVTLAFNNGYKITRLRSSTKNQYILTLPDGTQQVFEGFGTSVPLEIQQVHNIKKVLIDTDTPRAINISHQLESPFLISEPAATRAKAIGRMVGVHILDKASRETERDIIRLQNAQKSLNDQLEKTNNRLREFEKLENLHAKIKQREKQIEKIKDLQNKVNKLSEYSKLLQQNSIEEEKNKLTVKSLSKLPDAERLLLHALNLAGRLKMLLQMYLYLEDINKKMSETKILINFYRNIKSAEQLCDKLVKYNERLKALMEKFTSYRKTVVEISTLQELNNKFERIEDVTRKIYPHLEYKFNRLVALKENLKTLNIINEKILLGQNYLISKKKEIALLFKQYQTILKKLGRCPLCYQEINDHIISRILKEDRHERL